MLGEIRTGKITDSNAEAYFVQIDGLTFKLKKEEITQEETPEIGGQITGFIYDNQKHEREMTQFLPFAQADQYGWATVTRVQRGLGVFLDIGLPDKDIVMSLDDLPLDPARWPQKDDRLLVRLETDDKDRIWAKAADENIFEQIAVRFPNNLVNKNLLARVYSSKSLGSFVLTNDYYLGFIHESQMQQPLRLGEEVKARVIGVSQYGRLNMSVLPRAFEEIDDDAAMIMMSLRRRGDKTLAFSDKSDAQAIKDYFGISKSAFKRALGNLIKRGLVSQDKEAGTIKLVKDEADE